MSQPLRHIFVCRNERPATGKPSCGARGSEAVLEGFQAGIAARPDLWANIGVTACACLGPCFDGPTVVVYPEAVWYAGVTAADVAEIIDRHLVGGLPVERLRYRWPD